MFPFNLVEAYKSLYRQMTHVFSQYNNSVSMSINSVLQLLRQLAYQPLDFAIDLSSTDSSNKAPEASL